MTPVVGTLLEGPCRRMAYYTDLRVVIDAFGGRAREFDWLFTDVECVGSQDAFDGDDADSGGRAGRVVPGADLAEFLRGLREDTQFVWAVLSGVPTGVPVGRRPSRYEPYADGNGGFWGADLRIQLPGATVELVCWDSSCVILLTTDADLTRRFRAHFPEAVDLGATSRRRGDAG